MLSKKLNSALNKLPRILTESDSRFTTKDVDALYTEPKELPKGVMSILVPRVTVVWGLNFEERGWGIKGIDPEVLEIYGRKEFESDDPSKQNWDEDFAWNVKDYSVTFNTEEREAGIYPVEVQIDEQRKEIRVTFGIGLL